MKRLTLALAATGVLTISAGAQAPQTRTVYVSVTDETGEPASGLAPADLTVTEDGTTRHVLAVETASAPLTIGLVLDDRALWAPPVRAAVRGFAQSFAGRAKIGLFSYSRPEWTVEDFTDDTSRVVAAIDSMAAVPTGTNDPEGLMQTLARRFRKEEASRPVLVVLTFGSPDCGPRNCPSSVTPRWDLVLDDILKSGTTVYAVGTLPIEPAHLVYASADATGGTAERLMTDSAVSLAMQKVAKTLLHRYAVTYYSAAAPKDGFHLKVRTTRPGLDVRAPDRVFD